MTTEQIPITIGYPSGPPRSPGVHVSRVLKAIAVETKVLKEEWITDDLGLVEVGDQEAWWESLDPASQLRMSIGLAWEEWFLPQLEGVVKHPGEMCVDGIYMTHDGESLDILVSECDTAVGGTDRYTIALHEVKATYKSTKTVGDLRTQWLWLSQTKAYCKGLGTTVAYLYVLFLCGDYKYPLRPQLRCWKITYTQAEIDDNWDLITGYVRHQQLLAREEDHGLEGGV